MKNFIAAENERHKVGPTPGIPKYFCIPCQKDIFTSEELKKHLKL